MAGDISKSVNVAINVINGVSKQVGSIVSSFGKITEGANKSTKAVGNLNKALGNLKAPTGIKNLSKDLKSLQGLDTSGVTKLADGIKRLSGVKFPSFAKINTELGTHTKRVNDLVTAYGNLSKAASKVNLKNFNANAKTATKQVNQLGGASNKTTASFSQWGYALGSASTGLSKFGTQIYGVTRGFSAVSKEMGLAMAAFTTSFAALFVLKGVVSDIAKFDDALRSAGAVAQASSVQLTQLSDAARAMGESTRYTATDAAEALRALAMTGLDVNESIATLPTVLNLAAAANMDLGESADIVTNIMVGYGKTVGDLPHIADLMTAAFTNSNTSLQELGIAMRYVGPVAKAAGQSIEETTGILASLANAGYRGSKAGTTLRTAFSRLLAPTNKMSQALGHYGIQLKDLTEPNGDLKSFTDILTTMREKSITAGDALTIFGKRAGPGVLALIGQGTEAIQEMNDKIAESEGTALKAAYEMEAGLGGALRKLRSMWEEVSIAIGKTIEQDVQGFLEALTKSLKDNKEQIVEVVSALFQFVGVVAKVVGWMASFVASHFKMLSAITAITVAVKLLTVTSKEFMAIGIVNYFSKMFTSIKWSGIATGIAGVANALNVYSGASKTATNINATLALQGLATTPFQAIKTGLLNIGSALVSAGVAAGKAAFAFAAANIPLAIVAGLAVAAYTAMKLLDKDYAGTAESATKMAKAAGEVNRELEYQLAELGLINKEYDRSSTNDYSSAQERLRDVINGANLTIDERIDFLKRSREGSDEAKKVIDELTASIEKEKKANDAKVIKQSTIAREAQAAAVEEQAKNLEYYYGVSIDGQTRLNGLEAIAAKTNTLAPILWLKKKLGYLDENIDKYEELKAQQKVMDGNYQTMIATMITGKKSTEEFTEALRESGATDETIDQVTESFVKLKAEAEANKDVMDDLARLSASAVEAMEADAERQLDSYKSNNKEREAVAKQTLYNIAVLEAQGQISHETAEMAKLQATLDSSQAQVDAAKATYNSIDTLAVEGRQKALDAIVEAEGKAAATRLAILQKLADTEQKLNDKLEGLNKKRTDAISANETKVADLRKNNADKHTELEKTKTDKIDKIETALGDKLKAIEDSLHEKRKELAQQRVDIIQAANQKIAGIETSTEDKIRAIRQRGMTDEQKDLSNRAAANKKLKEGQALVAEAKKTGDEAALARGTSLIQQSQDLSSGLTSQASAVNGVKKAGEALKEAEKVRAGLALQDIADKVKAEEDAAAKKKKLAEDAAADAKGDAETTYDDKLKAADKFYQEELAKEDANHTKKLENIDAEITKYGEKLTAIENEKQLVLDLIQSYNTLSNTDAGGETWTKANQATDEAIQKVDAYSQAVDGINDKTVDIKFTGTASPTEPLGAKLDSIKKDLGEIAQEITVNIVFMVADKTLTAGLAALKTEVEGLEINIPATVNMAQLDAAIKLINEYKKKDILVDVKVESGQLNQTANTLKAMVNKTVVLTMKVNGYDSLVKAKNMIDSIKSKTVTITTKHKNVTEKAAGGLIEPEHYATGGNVFKRLSNRFIGSGGGKKDDVPAMLMKGEFVQKVSAVKKYGKDFMARLNAGLIPASVARMFSQGGDVQPAHFATGGHVGYSNMSSMLGALPDGRRKKILDLFEDKLLKISDAQIASKAESMTTEIGASSIAKMSETMADAVASFASGGSLNAAVAALSSQKRDITNDYKLKVAEQTDQGNSQMAEVLTKEKDNLLSISQSLKEELAALKTEYDEYVKDATETYNEEKADREESYNDSREDAKKSYDDEQGDADDSHEDSKEDYEKERAATEAEYLGQQATIYADIVSSREDLQEKAKALNDLGKFVQEIGNINGGRSYTGEDTFFFKENFTPRSFYGDETNPSKDLIEGLINSSFTHGDSTLGTQGKSDAINELEKLWSEYEVSKAKFGEFGITNAVPMLKEIGEFSAGALGLDKVTGETGDILQDIAKSFVDGQKNSALGEIDLNWKDVDDDYKEATSERSANYRETEADAKKDYEEGDAESKETFQETLADAKKSYEENVASATTASEEESESVKANSSSEIDSIKASLEESLKELEVERDSRQDALSTNQTSNDYSSFVPEGKTESKTSGSILEILKRKYGIYGFNTGGYVNPTSTSVPGKDSILSALTPDEYVMKASVVRKFGKGFFDSLNNFRIPQFNTGGIVGEGSSLISGAASTVKHALELNINGRQHGELTGSSVTISDLLNDLALAKMRA